MAGMTFQPLPSTPGQSFEINGKRNGLDYDDEDVFSSDTGLSSQSYQHRFSSRFDTEPLDLSSTTSPSQLRRTIEAHLQETDRRLQETQKLGTSLLKQRDDLTSKLEEVENFQDEAHIPNDLRRRLADIEREHADVSREVARALIGPKQKQEDFNSADSGVFTSQATGSPTKVSAPSRRHRNQPSTRAGDLQFAADISTSLLAQVRQLQATIVERDDTIRSSQAEKEAIEQDLLAYTQKIRALDESEQKYKDENWNLETQRHELLSTTKDAHDKEKRLNASLGAAVAEKARLQNELDDLKMLHSKLSEEHTATRKAHDAEIHGLKRNVDLADTDRQALQDKMDELISQNQELAKAISNRSRSRQMSPGEAFVSAREDPGDGITTPDDSPPASPTKATPRHAGLESETLRSSLHHAHRMIQNLKGNIHREKTEKIELKRMLQDARDELEQRRGDSGSAAKRQKTKPEAFKKPARPDMLGGNRRPRTDVELADDGWEDHNLDSPSNIRSINPSRPSQLHDQQPLTDLSDAYQTANETEGNFDTADERMTTESEAFMTGAESLAGDSTDELTETEGPTSKTGRPASGRVGRASLAAKSVGDRPSYLRSASTSGEEAENTQTPMQTSFTKFKLRGNRASVNRQASSGQQGTPESFRSQTLAEDSPATVTTSQSPALGEQSLFAELGGMDEVNSDAQSTPARSSIMSSEHSTPDMQYTPSKSVTKAPSFSPKGPMVDSATMTEPWIPEGAATSASQYHGTTALQTSQKTLLPSGFPLPPSVPTSPIRGTENSTQYTPQRSMVESPVRPTSSHITPPKTIWDEEQEPTSPGQHAESRMAANKPRSDMDYSGVLSQNTRPIQSPEQTIAISQRELEKLQIELNSKEAELQGLHSNHVTALGALRTELEALRSTHTKSVTDKDVEIDGMRNSHAIALRTLQADLDDSHKTHSLVLAEKIAELNALRDNHATAISASQMDLEDIQNSHATAISASQMDLENLRNSHFDEVASMKGQIARHTQAVSDKDTELVNLREEHAAVLANKEAEMVALRSSHAAVLEHKQVELNTLQNNHAAELAALQEQISGHDGELRSRRAVLENLRGDHASALAARQVELEHAKSAHAAEVEKSNRQTTNHNEEISRMRNDLESLRTVHNDELERLRTQMSGQNQDLGSKQTEVDNLKVVHAAELDHLRRQIVSHGNDVHSKGVELEALRASHSAELEDLRRQISLHVHNLSSKQTDLTNLQEAHDEEQERSRGQMTLHTQNLRAKEAELETLRKTHNEEVEALRRQVSLHTQDLNAKRADLFDLQKARDEEYGRWRTQTETHAEELTAKQSEFDTLQQTHYQEVDQLGRHISENREMLDRLQSHHNDELIMLRSQLGGQSAELEGLRSALRAYQVRHAALNSSAYSSILSHGTQPQSPDHSVPISMTRPDEIADNEAERPRTAERFVGGSSLVSSAATVGFAGEQIDRSVGIRGDSTSRQMWATEGDIDSAASSRREESRNANSNRTQDSDDVFGGPLLKRTSNQDHNSRTMPSAEQRGPALTSKQNILAPITIPANTHSPTRTTASPNRYPRRPSSRTREVSSVIEDPITGVPSSPQPRSGSASSIHNSGFLSQNYPPLPSDHRNVIAKANTQLGSPTRREGSSAKHIMGPPVMPASAMRAPKTPTESVRTANRVGGNGKRGVVGSQVSRRSSVSSFASELDERFNIRAEQQTATHGFEAGPGTDPRMIQAITQTMIGEFLWKYTRKAGSKEMSSTRHRRYFWVHPYTKTLYWSDQDPQTAGRTELKAKSVAIESVRVVSDDNPMPPGLHRKSLEVTTPGRKVKFTASTGQRHETWFNALSYLLNRGDEQGASGAYATNGSEITRDDIAEFSVNGYGARLMPNDRLSMSSYNSRTTNGTSRRVRQSLPAGVMRGSTTSQGPQTQDLQSPSIQASNDTIRGGRLEGPQVPDKDRTIRGSSTSRISKMFGSVASRTRNQDAAHVGNASSRDRGNSSIYNASVVSDGRREEEEEAVRRQEHESKPGLEDVRACCDGKHNVGTLDHHHTSGLTAQTRFGNAVNRSVSRRT